MSSGFNTQTCNLLSQFLKGKGRTLKDISPQIATQLEAKDYSNYNKANILPKVLIKEEEEEEKEMTQMTIFYAGKVMVFDFPPTKANHLLTTIAHHQLTPQPQPQLHAPVSASDLPIARRASLHRFLDKRKARVMAKAPYHNQHINGKSQAMSSSSSSKDPMILCDAAHLN